MADIFLSYSSKDRARARVLAEALGGLGWSVWWDRKLLPGDRYPHLIEEQLVAARCVVVLWSRHSIRSDYVRGEATKADDRHLLVAVLLDDIAGDLPVPFNQMHVVKLADWEGDPGDPPFAILIEALRKHAGEPGAIPPLDWQGVIGRFLRQIGVKLSTSPGGLRPTRMDLLVLVILIGAVVVQTWLWHIRFNTTEKWFWGSSVVAAGFLWYVLRHLSLRPSLKHAPVAFLMSASRVVLSILVVTGWVFAGWRVYRVDRFPAGVNGLFIARLANDPDDHYQRMIEEFLKDFSEKKDLHRVAVCRLPRLVTADEAARELGRGGGALLVLWGWVTKAADSSRINAHLAILGTEGLFEGGGTVEGRVALGGLPDLPVGQPLTVLQEVLARFFAGYSRYRVGDRAGAKTYFEQARRQLDPVQPDEPELSPVEGTRGSLDFYLANLAYLSGQVDSAKIRYRAAIAGTSQPSTGRPNFVEPLNNLALILKQQGHSDSAEALLQQADTICRSPGERSRTTGCAYVSYNLGLFRSDRGEHKRAVASFAEALRQLGLAERADSSTYAFEAYTRQQIAYAYARQGEAATPDTERTELYRRADRAMGEAETAWQKFNSDTLPTVFKITKGRIRVGLRRWDEALVLLTQAGRVLPGYADVYLLSAIAHVCKAEYGQAEDLLTKYKDSQTVIPELIRGMNRFEADSADCVAVSLNSGR